MIACIVLLFASVFFLGVTRPFYLAFLLMPCVVVLAKRKSIRTTRTLCLIGLSALVALTAIVLYFYFRNNYSTPYFIQTSGEGLEAIRSQGILGFFVANWHALKEALRLLAGYQWAGVMIAMFAINTIVIAIMAIGAFRQRELYKFWLLLSFLAASIAIFEANLIL